MTSQLNYSAGRFRLEVWWEGSPTWIKLYLDRDNEATIHGLRISELKDLHYVIGRIIEDAKSKEAV